MEPESQGMLTTRWGFFVGGKAHVVHQMGVDPGTNSYYATLAPEAFLYWTVVAAQAAREAPKLDGGPGIKVEAAVAAHLSALRFRMHHLNLLETFFAQFFANVQAPQQPAAWLTLYSSATLSKLVGRLTGSPWKHDDATRALAHPQELLGWLFGVERRSDLDEEGMAGELTTIQAIIRRLASEFTNPGTKMEYNAIKHGARAYSSPWQLGLGLTGAPGPAATLGTGHGSHFGLRNSQCGHVHAWRERSQGWDLDRDIEVSTLVSKLMFSLVQARRRPQPGRKTPYFNFRHLDLGQIFTPGNQISHFEMGHPDLPKAEWMDEAEATRMANEEQVEFEEWLCRLGSDNGGQTPAASES